MCGRLSQPLGGGRIPWLVQVGAFPHFGGRWGEWNGTFRDDVRQFIKGTDGDFIGAFASALMGSPEIYGKSECAETDWWGKNDGARWRGGRGPQHTVNFVTAHDGFSLADLVSYNEKHNVANGENNNDGVPFSCLFLSNSFCVVHQSRSTWVSCVYARVYASPNSRGRE